MPRTRLWFGTCAGAVAWAIHGFICTVISSVACSNGNGSLGPLSTEGVRLLLAAITLALLGVTIAGGLVSFRNWRELSETGNLVQAAGDSRESFMALVGTFLSIALALGIVWAGLPLILVGVCVNAR
ncbi:MAG TPA: hypothetical protein VHB50_14730 [Bryobacteraceae bacterium]|nr:hypothetical protein [Bryobacteraceae bacterium]